MLSVRRTFQILAFLMASIVEVEVKAQEFLNYYEVKKPIELPADCLIESTVCTVKTLKKQKYNLRFDQTAVVLSANTTYVRLSAQAGTLVEGVIFVSTQKPFRIETPYGFVEASDGEFLVYNKNKQIMVRTMSGRSELHPRGHATPLRVSAGYENWMGRVDVSGKALVGIPRALDFDEFVLDMAAIYPGSRKEFLTSMRTFQDMWSDALRETALIHENKVKREIAAENERQKEKALKRQKWEAERAYFRELFMKKLFE